MNTENSKGLTIGTTYQTAIEGWQNDWQQAEIRGYAHIVSTLNKDGTYTVEYWDRDWKNDPCEFVVISKRTLTKEGLLVDIQERNEFIERTIQRYERQKASNTAFAERVRGHK